MKKHKVRKTGIGFRVFCFFGVLTLVTLMLLKYTNDRVMPSVEKTMEAHGANKSMQAINTAVRNVFGKTGITTPELYTRTVGENGRLTSLSANTVLINSLCAEVAEEVIACMERLEDETTYLPLGAITGIDFLAARGPETFEVTVRPVGSCTVDYETSFKSEGINQVNYQIWLLIRMNVSASNPVAKTSFIVERKLPVVNTYIGGDVPESMLYPFKID